jgi:cysteine desulfurase/selenocysteine lyase
VPRACQCSRPPLAATAPRALADGSGYFQPGGERRSRLLVDGVQLVPGSFVDVQAMGADYLAFSFHKLLAPFGVGVLYAREQLLGPALPFLYGGDMIAEGRVFPGHVEYNALPWKYAAGTPNIRVWRRTWQLRGRYARGAPRARLRCRSLRAFSQVIR